MKKLEESISESLSRLIQSGNTDYNNFERRKWFEEHLSQVLMIVNQVIWTETCENYLFQMNQKAEQNKKKIKKKNEDDEEMIEIQTYLNDYKQNLDELTSLVREDLPKEKHKTIVGLITTEVHNRDVLDMLIKQQIDDVNNFFWQQQLRTYLYETTDWKNLIKIRQINSIENYGFEYYGPSSSMVITPLTEKCWITITSALHMKLGASLAGPAGTGKTESTKDLAKSLGRFCVVYNCSEQIQYNMMEKQFRGAIKQGAWICFDEFNRIYIEVLSVIAQQLLEIRLTLEDGESFDFCGKSCVLNENCGIIITMNPDYSGRSQLPDNLKALFRQIAMMIPNYRMIAEVQLFSQGFVNSKNLSWKMLKLFRLSSEQLSQLSHYDFGMRGVKSVLDMTGRLKKKNQNADETKLLIRAMKDSNIPKFLKKDLKLFNALICDLFPDVELPDTDHSSLEVEIRKDLISKNLQPKQKLVQKVTQLYDTINVRFGIVLLGNSLVGKTTSLYSLRDSMTSLNIQNPEDSNFKSVHLTELNPKSISMGELFGFENPLTKDWNDGIASHYIRKASEEKSIIQKWISFDGPVDSIWIENMNSVLDETRMLCLLNGQRIRLHDNMRIIFEVDNLLRATPATISRCGIVYYPESVLGWDSYLNSWLDKIKIHEDEEGNILLEEEIYSIIFNMCDSFMPVVIKMFEKMPKVIPISSFQSVKTFCDLFFIMITNEKKFKFNSPIEFKSQFISLVFIFAAAWSFGGSLLDTEGKRPSDKIDALIKKKFNTMDYLTEPILNCYIDSENLILRPYIDLLKKENEEEKEKEENNAVVSLDQTEPKKAVPFWDILVSTCDTLKISRVCELLIEKKQNVFLIGGSGCGKSVVTKKLFNELSIKKNVDNINFYFSAQTDTFTLYESILKRLFSRNLNTKGASLGREMVILIEDVNMPAKEKYGAQPPLEILRQIMDKKILYDKKEMDPIYIENTNMFVIAAPPEGGRNPLDARFMGHFSVVAFPLPTTQTIQRIFNHVLKNSLKDFEDIIKNISSDIVLASVEFYEKIIKEKLPIPSKFHYTFNLRDLSKMIMGVSKANPETYKEPKDIVSLWNHEMSRVFHDRLKDKQDKKWFFDLMDELIDRHFKIRASSINYKSVLFSDIYSIDQENKFYEEIELNETLIKTFENFQSDYNENPNQKLNLVFFDYAIIHILRIIRILSENRGNGLLIGVGGLGKQSLTKLSAFIVDQNIVELPGTNSFEIDKFKEWLCKEVLVKCAGGYAGKNGQPICFLISDSMISSEIILEYMSNLLNCGEVPNLFNEEDYKKLMKGLSELYSDKDEKEKWNKFVERVRENLHIMMCMSPVGNLLQQRCQQFPALINCCSINWFDDWESTAIESVAKKILEKTDIEYTEDIANALKSIHEEAIQVSKEFVQKTSRKCFITPKTALDNVELLSKLYCSRRDKIIKAQEILIRGSEKLEETSKIVAELKIQLEKDQPKLEEKKEATEKMMVELEKTTKINQEKWTIVEEEKKKRQILTEQIEIIKNESEQQLSKVLPMIKSAEAEVSSIPPKSISSLKTFSSPPENIKFIMMNICVALGKKYVNWSGTAVPMLSDVKKFINSLLKRIEEIKIKGASVIPVQSLKIIEKNLKNDYFKKEKLDEESLIGPLGKWVIAVYNYTILKKNIEPLEKNANEVNLKLKEAKKEFDRTQSELNDCKAYMNELQEKYTQLINSKKELEENIQKTKVRLTRAEKLTSLLVDENLRWKESIKEYEEQIKYLLSDTVISSSIISYLGAFDSSSRSKLLNKIKEIVILKDNFITNPSFNFLKVMGDPLELKQWSLNGLPSDFQSQTSAIISMNSTKWPLMVDPQKQASNWLKNYNKTNEDFIIINNSTDEKKKLYLLKMAMMNGKTVFIDGTQEHFESALEPILGRKYFVNAIDQRILINFNDEVFDYHPHFNLLLSCKNSNPNFLPEIFIKLNVINFTVIQEGLEEQLLAEVVKLEKPEIERQKNEIIEKVSGYKKELLKFEEEILNLLAGSSDKFIEDSNLVTTLESSKEASQGIKEKVKKSIIVGQTIEKAREAYRPVAKQGSILFFVVRDLAIIDTMYEYSLQYVIKIIKNAITHSKKSSKINQRILTLQKECTKEIFLNISRGLFERHKPIFSFLIAVRINMEKRLINNSSWDLFLRGNLIVDKETQLANPDPNFISEEAWNVIWKMNNDSSIYMNLQQSLVTNLKEWKEILSSENILEQEMSSLLKIKKKKSKDSSGFISNFSSNKNELNNSESKNESESQIDVLKDSKTSNHVPVKSSKKIQSLNETNSILNSSENNEDQLKTDIKLFDKLILTKYLSSENLLKNISHYVRKTLGKEYLNESDSSSKNSTNNLCSLVQRTNPSTPIIFILTQGAEPSAIINSLIEKMNYSLYDKLLTISLGQGQGKRAQKLINRASNEGMWILLENCHLARNWLPTLEQIIDELQDNKEKEIHPEFRLFLTSMPADYFPSSILQNGVKITTEPPKGLKNNIRRSINNLSENFFEVEKFLEDKRESNVDKKYTKKKSHRDSNHVDISKDPNLEKKLSEDSHETMNMMKEKVSDLAKFRLVTSLSLFHAIIQERKNFGPIGWNKPYDFNDSDFQAGKDIISMMVSEINNKKDIPWESLFFLVGTITYGGRVTDKNDKRLLHHLLKRFMNEQVLDERYKFFSDERYKIPKISNQNDVLDFVSNLPNEDPPEICGLNENASISFQKQETFRILQHLLDISPQIMKNGNSELKKKVSSAKLKEESKSSIQFEKKMKLSQTKIIAKILEDMPDIIDIKRVHKQHTIEEDNGLIPPLSTVLFQEIERYNNLLNVINKMLNHLIKAIEGKSVITETLEKTKLSIQNNRVPDTWQEIAYPSLKSLSSWFKDLHLRVKFMNYWLINGSVPHFWLPGFFFPQGFLTAVLQTHARKYNLPIDKFSFIFKITDQDSDKFFDQDLKESGDKNKVHISKAPKKRRTTRLMMKPGMKNFQSSFKIKRKGSSNFRDQNQIDGVFISGLFLEGADWNRKRKLLIEQQPKQMYTKMPLIHFLPTEKLEQKGNWYSCPLYKTLDRKGTLDTTGISTNFILNVALSCDKNKSLWVLRGVALFCAIND